MLQVEKYIHKLLSRSPLFKDIVKYVYQIIFLIFSRKKTNINASVLKKFKNAFVGFHDVTCYSTDFDFTVFHRVNIKKRPKITATDTVDIYVYDFVADIEQKIDATKAFNWQMGSRLQVLSFGDIVWNTIEGNILTSKTFKNGSIRVNPYSIYSVSNDGIAATVNFSNIEKHMPGYGYVGSFSEICQSDEILIWNLKDSKKIKSIILKNFPENCFITHLQFNQGGDLLAFFVRKSSHRYSYFTELLVYDWRTEEIVARSIELNVITHFTWCEQSIVMFCLYEDKFQYVKFDVLSGEYSVYDKFRNLADGHPSFQQGKGIVTDTYPDRRRQQKLYYNCEVHETLKLIGDFYSPLYYRGYSRVDLHPRLHRNGLISIDCVESDLVCTVLLTPN